MSSGLPNVRVLPPVLQAGKYLRTTVSGVVWDDGPTGGDGGDGGGGIPEPVVNGQWVYGVGGEAVWQPIVFLPEDYIDPTTPNMDLPFLGGASLVTYILVTEASGSIRTVGAPLLGGGARLVIVNWSGAPLTLLHNVDGGSGAKLWFQRDPPVNHIMDPNECVEFMFDGVFWDEIFTSHPNLYRIDSGELGTDGAFTVGGSVNALAGIWSTGPIWVQRSAIGNVAIGVYLDADTENRFEILMDGKMGWGPGIVPTDAFLYRSDVQTLHTNSWLESEQGFAALGGEYYASHPSDPNAWTFESGLDTDARPRFVQHLSGKHNWGGGVNPPDTFLYRQSAGVLKTDGTFDANVLSVNGVPVTPGGASITYRGDYSASTTYHDGDYVVGPDGRTYQCVKEGTVGVAPTPWAPAPQTAYGTTLPTAPFDGQEAILVDSATNPNYKWRFRYNAASTSAYKWEFIGGDRFYQGMGNFDNTTGASAWVYANSGFVFPRAGDYDVSIQCAMGNAAGAAVAGYLQWAVGNAGIPAATPGIIHVTMLTGAEETFFQSCACYNIVAGTQFQIAHLMTAQPIHFTGPTVMFQPKRVS